MGTTAISKLRVRLRSRPVLAIVCSEDAEDADGLIANV